MDSHLRSDAMYALELFNEMSAELDSAGFTTSVRAGKTGWSLSWRKGEGTSVERRLPHAEEIKAYVLTFRLFFQKSEEFSFWRLRRLYPTLDISPELRAEAEKTIADLNSYLDSMSTIVMDNEQVTRRHVLDVVLNGGMAHANNRTNKEIMDHWASRPDLHIIIEGRFVEMLNDLTLFVTHMRQVNLRTLAELSVETGRPE